MNKLTLNAVTLVAVVLGIAAVLWILQALAGRLINRLSGLPALARFEGAAQALRRNLKLLTVLVGTLSTLGLCAGGAYLMYRGEEIPAYTLKLIRGIPASFWIQLAVSFAKVASLLVLAAVGLGRMRRLLDSLCQRAKDADELKANDESIEQIFGFLRLTLGWLVWLGVLYFSAGILGLPEPVHLFAYLALKICAIIAIGVLISRSVDTTIISLDALSRKHTQSTSVLRHYDKLSHLVPVLRRSVEAVLYVTVATLVVLQIELIASLAEWGPRIIRIIGVLFLCRVLIEIVRLVVEESMIKRPELSTDERRSRVTMVPLLLTVIKYVIWFGAAVIAMKEVGIDPIPILAGAGIVGIAIGLGAQNFINDLVSGFSILFENYYLVGDYVRIGKFEGVVEAIDLDTTRLRDESGCVHVIRNGQVENATNYSKHYTHAVLRVGVAYASDLATVTDALKLVGKRIAAESPDVLEPGEVLGVDELGEHEITMMLSAKVKPGRHRQVERDLRRLVKDTFDEYGIEIPYARRVVISQSTEISPRSSSPAEAQPSSLPDDSDSG